MQYYVDVQAAFGGDWSKNSPFQKIQQAADLARPGDEVLVAPGIYREYVNPKNAGTSEQRITYRSIEPLKAVITGAEPVKNWEKAEGTVWTARVSNEVFGDYNPYTTLVFGDWFIATMIAHTGDVYLNHKSMYEVTEKEKVYAPVRSAASWDPDFSVYVWYCEQDENTNETVFFANFQGMDPNQEEVEISVRQDCFLPAEEGISYITLSGFTVREAATQWAPPTAYQDGMIGPHWSKGWIIEDCEVYESKCSGISLGKYLQPNNDNKWSKWKYKDGTQTERDCICQASYEGWDKEHIGSHIVRRCHIHDCGQTGIVGHLGGVFSIIEDNHIHNINNKQNLAGAEIGGIKMHAAIDVIFRRNHIHHCTRGLWLDWQAQGTRVTQNLFHHNTLPVDLDHVSPEDTVLLFLGMGEDIFVEVSHGPTLIDNNFLLSPRSIKFATQGIAMVHNLVAGSLTCVGTGTDNGAPDRPSPRYTPYHAPHDTQIAGFMTFLHGDDRFYNNIFVQMPVHPVFQGLQDYTDAAGPEAKQWDTMNFRVGTWPFDEYPTFEEWDKMFEGYCGMASPRSNRYYSHLPVWAGDNIYLGGAKPWAKEEDPVVLAAEGMKLDISFTEDASTGSAWQFTTNLYDYVPENTGKMITTETLGMAFEPEECYENPDGTPIAFDTDFFGDLRDENPMAGPCVEKTEDFVWKD